MAFVEEEYTGEAQTFGQSVRESRIFYRRRLAERLAVAMSGFEPDHIAAKAEALMRDLAAREDAELKDVK